MVLWLNEQVIRDTFGSIDRMLTYRQHVEKTALNCKKGLSVLKAMAAKGIEHATSSYCIKVWCSESLTMD